VWQYFSHSLIQNTFAVSSRILDIMVTSAIIFKPTRHTGERDDLKLVSNTLEWTIINFNKLIQGPSNKGLQESVTVTFWALWNFLLERLQELGSKYFAKHMLLDASWNKEATSWPPLEFADDFYQRSTRHFGSINLLSAINVLATIGDQTLLPEALTWVVAILKAESTQYTALMYPNSIQFVERLYHRHMARIKDRRALLQDFIWLLDTMVDAGLSKAYLIRENVITYKLQV
jgi:hypothetical protein